VDVFGKTRVKVGFGCTVLANGLRGDGIDGIGAYTRELGQSLTNEALAELSPLCFGPAPEKIGFGAAAPRSLGRYVRYAGLSAVSPLGFPDAGLAGLDLFHATDHLIPKFRRCPVVATLMDAIPLAHPEWVRMRLVGLKNWLWRRAAHWADHVLTISEYSKREISRHFGIAPDRISVAPLGVDARYFERFDAAVRQEVLRRLGLPNGFYLFIGTIQPRKNLERLLEAHAGLPPARQKETPLVIVGRRGWGCDDLVVRLTGDASLRGRVYWMNYLPDSDARALMQSARALVFPSLCEGFGLPVLEAFASGLPVIASNASSLPEVAGDAALLVDPLDSSEICHAMREIVDNPGLAERLAAAGLARAREFTWAECARRTAAVYRRVLNV
jgi:alpha-1,3-rhamnosyl/mannosyltransferase